MAAAIGALEIQLLADLSRLRSDMDSAKGIVGNAANGMTSAFGAVKTALAAVGVGLSAAAFANWIKGSIDAADSMKAFSQKTGIAVKDVAGLQLAFKQGGVESEALGSAMAKMTRNMATGSEAFKLLGVATHNADGTLRGAKDVLYDTADAIASVKGESERVALAMDVFGKSGAQLLPVFENGAEGLREMADMADKLGLSMDGDAAEAADRFNDTLELLGMATQGVGRQVATQLLPALNGIVGAFLNFITEGDRVQKMAEFISTGLRLLYSAGVALVQVFSTVGKTAGAALAQIVAVMNGDFKGAIAIGKEWADDMKTDWAGAIKNVGDAWEGTSADTTKALATVTRSMRDVKIATDAQKDAQKDAARATKEAAKEFEKQQKEKEKLLQAEMDLQSKRAIAVIASYEKEQQAVDDSITKADEMVAAILRETEALGMSNTEREISNALLALEKAGLEKGTYAYELYAEKVRAAVVDKAAVAQSIEQSKQIADNWTALTKEIGQGLTDSLFRAFESGKSFFKTLWDGIVNTFKTTVLRLAINAVMNPINAGIGSLLGGGSSLASAATGSGGGFDLLSGLGSLGGIGSALGTFGTAAGYGASALFSGTGLTALSGAGSMIGAGSMAGGLGMAAGVLGPVAAVGAGLYALYKSLSDSGTPHTGAALTATSGGLTNLGESWRNIDPSKSTTQALGTLAAGLAGTIQTLASIGSGGQIEVGAGYADDKSKDPAWGAFRIMRDGQALTQFGDLDRSGAQRFADGSKGLDEYMAAVAGGTGSAIGKLGLPDWAQEIIDALGASPTLEQLAKATEQIVAQKAEMDAVKEAQVEQTQAQIEYGESTIVGLDDIQTELSTLRDKLVSAIDSLRVSAETGLAAVAAASQATTSLLNTWDDGGALVTTPAP